MIGLSLGGVAVGAATRPTARVVARLLNWLLACYGLYSLKLAPNPATLERPENRSRTS